MLFFQDKNDPNHCVEMLHYATTENFTALPYKNFVYFNVAADLRPIQTNLKQLSSYFGSAVRSFNEKLDLMC